MNEVLTPALPEIWIEPRGFHLEEIIKISAGTLGNTYCQYGQKTREVTKHTLSGLLNEFRRPKERKAMSQTVTKEALLNFFQLTYMNVFTLDGVNYGLRYLEQLMNMAVGADLSSEAAVFIQMEIEARCQTLMVQDKGTGLISVVHAEENSHDSDLVRLNRRLNRQGLSGNEKPRTQKEYRYRMATLESLDHKVTFLAYPGLIPGSTIGINHRTQTLVAVDSLHTNNGIDPTRSVWGNAVASMIFDIGDIEKVKKFMGNLKKNHLLFSGGYAVHMAQAGTIPSLVSFEFGADQVAILPPEDLPDRKIIAQANYPRSPNLASVDELAKPLAEVRSKSKQDAVLKIIMERREKRLSLTGALAEFPAEPAAERLDRLTKLAANPYGDIRSRLTRRAKFRQQELSGLPGVGIAGFAVATLGHEGVNARFGKLLPPKIPHKEYGLTVGTSRRRFIGADLEKLADGQEK